MRLTQLLTPQASSLTGLSSYAGSPLFGCAGGAAAIAAKSLPADRRLHAAGGGGGGQTARSASPASSRRISTNGDGSVKKQRLGQSPFFSFAKLLSSDKLTNQLETLAAYNPTPFTMHHLLKSGRVIDECASYRFLRHEIPVRLANIMKELELLPKELQKQKSYCNIRDFYAKSFEEMVYFVDEKCDKKMQKTFTDQLKVIRTRHADTVERMADAVIKMKSGVNWDEHDHEMEHCLQYFLDRLYMSRISIHMLINQQCLLFGGEKPQANHVGAIHPECDAGRMVEYAFADAAFLCERNYMMAPELKIELQNTVDSRDDRIHLTYVPSHLYHILFELLKNALRATVERHQDAVVGLDLPAIRVKVVKGQHDISIRISDQGGGIARKDVPNLFKYMYTTASTPRMLDEESTMSMAAASLQEDSPMAGLGYGLPLSRLYARYFQGDITLSSMDGLGTDATVYLRTLPTEAAETLPVFNQSSKMNYENPGSLFSPDWTDPTAGLGRPPICRPNLDAKVPGAEEEEEEDKEAK